MNSCQEEKQNKYDEFGFTKFISWSTLFVVLASGILLSIIITNSTKTTLLEKQKEFSLLLAENINHQIYTRFYVPTVLREGRIELQQEDQFSHLDQVIQSTVHGLHMLEIRIYDLDRRVSYSTDRTVVGRDDLSDGRIVETLLEGEHSFEIPNTSSMLDILKEKEDSPVVIMETVYPLRIESSLRNPSTLGPIIGVLKIYQDITDDYRTVLKLQIWIIITTVLTSLLMFLTLFMIIRRVTRINHSRMAEREKMERTLAQNEKLVTIGRMVAGVAHEIRNPLGIIRSSSELLLKKTKDEDSLEGKILKAIYSESKRLSQTVNDFLDYARPKKAKREEINLARILEQALTFLANEFEKNNISLVKEYDQELIIKGDKDLLYRAFYNIIVNAIQAMDEPGELAISSTRDNDILNIHFRDTGSGFDEQIIDSIGEPFMTTKDYGTGLGLTIVINIINNNDGQVEFKNRTERSGAHVMVSFKAVSR